MNHSNSANLSVHDATVNDIEALVSIKGEGTDALHRSRLRDAESPDFRYLVLKLSDDVIGFACLVMKRPAYWSDGDDTRHLPQIVDLTVARSQRSRGYGTKFIRIIEKIAANAGHNHLYLSVAPHDNPRAFALYRKLNYQQIQAEPYRSYWQFVDSDGNLHRGEDWIVDMVIDLAGTNRT